jgi:hypothetical protein
MADNRQLEEAEDKKVRKPHCYAASGSFSSMRISFMFTKRIYDAHYSGRAARPLSQPRETIFASPPALLTDVK